MQIRLLEVRNFRGFSSAKIEPAQHVVVVGEPRAGRSDLVEGLTRVFLPDATRVPLSDDLDFFERDTTARPEIEAVVGGLGDELEQLFLDQLEYWDLDDGALVKELDDAEELDELNVEPVVRLCYRATWSDTDEQANQWVDFAKNSDPDLQIFERLTRAQREAFPFFAGHAGRRALSLGSRAHLRRLVGVAEGGDFAESLEIFTQRLAEMAEDLADVEQVKNALESVLEPTRLPLRIEDKSVEDIVRFMPEGGALGGLLRSLSPMLDLGDSAGSLPLARHGSTTAALLAAAEILAAAGSEGVVVIDDFGEELDSDTARHLAATLRSRTSQLWVTTRRPSVVQAFRAGEIIRLTLDEDEGRLVHHGREPETQDDRMGARHTALQLLPAVAARAVIVLEGPHDRSAIAALGERLLKEESVPLPAAQGIALADAGAEGGGGSSGLPRLTAAARRLGFFTVAVVDGDRADQAEAELAAIEEEADAVIRLPDGFAIERVLLDGLTVEEIRDAFINVGEDVPDDLEDAELATWARRRLKRRGGLHAQFLDALPPGRYPRLARRLLERVVQVAAERERGLIQL